MTQKLICGKCKCQKWRKRRIGIIELKVCIKCGNVMRHMDESDLLGKGEMT